MLNYPVMRAPGPAMSLTRNGSTKPAGFRWRRCIAWACGLLPVLVAAMFSACATTRFPIVERAPNVNGRVHRREPAGPHPAVVVLHGNGGMREVYHEEAEFLAKHDYVVLVLDYYAQAGLGGLSGEERQRRWRQWQDMLVDSVEYLRGLPDVDPDRVALVGFSQGAALAVSTAHRIPGLGAIVDFFGPNVEGWYVSSLFGNRDDLPDDYLERLPPVLILHGSRDPVVPKRNSEDFHSALVERGREVEMHVYEGSMHALNDPLLGSDKAEEVARDARERVLRFLDAHLGKSSGE